MDRNNWFFRQRVTNPEMEELQDHIEKADWDNVKEVLGNGIVSGGLVTENSPVSDETVLVGLTIARDIFGRRVNAQDFFADTVASVVRGLTLQLDGIAVPSTVGTYIMFTSQPPVEPFTLVGQTIRIARSQFPGNNGDFVIQQVATTDWGGLVPTQIMVRIDEELDPDGYESGLSPRGTTSIMRIESSDDSIANVAFDETNVNIRPVNPGNERYVSLYMRFNRFEFDQRLDGNAQVIQYVATESFKYVVDASEPEALIGTAVLPALRTNGDIFLADVRLETGADIFNADISLSRQIFMTTLGGTAEKAFQYYNLKYFGGKITWTGTTLTTSANVEVTLPNKTGIHLINSFSEVLVDGEVLYVVIDRNAASGTYSVVKVARGAVPVGDANDLVVELMSRRGTKVSGVLSREMEAGETADIGESIGEAYQTFTGMATENDSTPDYQNALGGGARPVLHITQDEAITKAIKHLEERNDTVTKIRVIDLVTSVLPVSAAVTLDGTALANGDIVLFTQAAIEGIYRVAGIGVAATWTQLRLNGGLLIPPNGATVQVKEGTAYFQTIWERVQGSWKPIRVSEATKEPTGFPNRTDSEILFDDGTRTFTVQPLAPATRFDVFLLGRPFRYTTAQTVVIPDSEGVHYFYFNTAGVLVTTQVFDIAIIQEFGYAGSVYWDATNNTAIILSEERHGLSMDGATHRYLHSVMGARLTSGLDIGNFSIVGTGALAADAQLSLNDASFFDEDIVMSIVHAAVPANPFEQILNPIAAIPVFSRDGASGDWRKTAATTFPLKTGVRMKWNKFALGTWTEQDATGDGKYVAMWVFVTNGHTDPVIAVMGQNEWPDLSTAQAGELFNALLLGALPTQEFKAAYRLIFETSSAFANAAKAALRDVRDIRAAEDTAFPAVSASDHGALSGLNDPDHGPTAVTTTGVTKDGALSASDTDARQVFDTFNKTLGQLKLTVKPSNLKRIKLTGVDRILNSGTIVSQELRNLILKFGGAEIDVQTGNVYESDGVTALGINFTPFVYGADHYFWYSVTLIPSVVTADNRITGQLLVLPATASNAVAANAPLAPFANGVKIGQFQVQEQTGAPSSLIEDILQSGIRQLVTGSGSGGSGTGDADELELELFARARRAFFDWLTPVSFAQETDTFEDPATDAIYDIVDSVYKFPIIGDQFVSIQLYGNEFLTGDTEEESGFRESRKIELHAQWDEEDIDTGATYEVSQDGGLSWDTFVMTRVGASGKFVGSQSLDEPTPAMVETYAVGNADGVQALDATNGQQLAQKFTVASKQALNQVTLYLNKLGSPLGNARLSIVKDDTGSPSLSPSDQLILSDVVSVAALAAGNVTVLVDLGRVIMPPGDYWWVLETDLAYKASFVAATHELRVRSDASAPTAPVGKTYNGTIWSVLTEAFVYLNEGFLYDLRVRITGSIVDTILKGFGVFFGESGGIGIRGIPEFQIFDIDGDDDVLFVDVTNFLPDPDLCQIHDLNTGQIWGLGSPGIRFDGHFIRWDAGTFLSPGETIRLRVDQSKGGSFDNSDRNAALLAAQGAGSTDLDIDRSGSGGFGPKIRRPDGVLRELTLDNFDVIVIKSTP